jgi:phenylalanyl-tRNA synthetase beta subunit
VITYSLISEEELDEEKENFYELTLPKSDFHKYYRKSAKSSHLKIIKHNLSHNESDIFIFEKYYTFTPDQRKEEFLTASGIGNLVKQKFQNFEIKLDYF